MFYSYGNAVNGELMHWYVSFVSDPLFLKKFIFKTTSILSVSCVLSSCGKSCSMCEMFTSSGCKYRLQDNSKKQRRRKDTTKFVDLGTGNLLGLLTGRFLNP